MAGIRLYLFRNDSVVVAVVSVDAVVEMFATERRHLKFSMFSSPSGTADTKNE